jgi:hypothetical protein
MHVTTDKNNMGGFFVRKLGGAAALTVHLQKLVPLLIHPRGAQWVMGHFRPLLWTGIVANCSIIGFVASYMEDLASYGCSDMANVAMGLLGFESVVFLYYLLSQRTIKRGTAIAMTNGKEPTSVTSRIVGKTVIIVSSAMSLIAARDLLFSGSIFPYIPRDDIYLEWTNAFLHSPPLGSPEDMDQGLEAPLFIGDKFVSQYMALNLLLLCLYKFVSAFMIRYGSDGSGLIKAKMFWKTQSVGGLMILFLFRMFSPAAATASLDLRWHLMLIGYEVFILGTYRLC